MLYEYDSLIIQYPKKKTDIDVVFDILYDTLNSTKQYIRVGSEDKHGSYWETDEIRLQRYLLQH